MSIGKFPPETVVLGPPGESLWRITVEKYHEMIDAGILMDGDPVELLEGLLAAKMPRTPCHRVATGIIRDALQFVLPSCWHVGSYDPITTADSEPEPDISVLRGQPRDYRQRHPWPADVALLVEIADASLARDRSLKKRTYARAAIAVYWIVNLVDNHVEVYTDPTGPAEQPDYRHRQIYRVGDLLPLILDNQQVARLSVADLLP